MDNKFNSEVDRKVVMWSCGFEGNFANDGPCVLQEEIEVKKDTERQDEIKAMKQAWEAAEPGRAAKVRQPRANI